VTRFDGFYWVSVEDGVDGPSYTTIGQYHVGSWRLPGVAQLIECHRVQVLSERIIAPVEVVAERLVEQKPELRKPDGSL